MNGGQTEKNLPLYKGIEQLDPQLANGNAGLWYDKFCSTWQEGWTMAKKANSPKEGPKVKWIKTVAGKEVGDDALLKEMQERQRIFLASRGLLPLLYKTDGPFVTGLGRSHPVENGFAWHHGLGVPYLPGSSVKGLIRNWVEIWDEPNTANLLEWFGSRVKDKAPRQAGGYIFLDALPIASPRLSLDILTPHMGQWYASGAATPGVAVAVPADWHDPVPSPFLVVKKATFSFGIIPKSVAFATRLAEVEMCLENALQWLGAGAKTAVGYGRMERDRAAHEKFALQLQLEKDRQRLAALSAEDRLREEVGMLTDESLALQLGRNFNKTRERYLEQGVWPTFVALVQKMHGRKMLDWQKMERNSNKRKALQKLTTELQTLNCGDSSGAAS